MKPVRLKIPLFLGLSLLSLNDDKKFEQETTQKLTQLNRIKKKEKKKKSVSIVFLVFLILCQ